MPLTERLSFTFSNSTRLEIRKFWSESKAMQNKAGVLDDGLLAGTGSGWKMSFLLRRGFEDFKVWLSFSTTLNVKTAVQKFYQYVVKLL